MGKNIFSKTPRESEIRPKDLFEQWKEILKEELAKWFSDPQKLIEINCPGCSSRKTHPAFMKFGFEYKRCNKCGTLFVSPRPSAENLRKFNRDSQATKFWEQKIMKASSDARQRHQILPLSLWISDLIRDYQPKAQVALDYKPRYFSLFFSDKNFHKNFKKIFLVEPLIFKDTSSVKNIKIVNNLKKLKGKVNVFTAFNVLDREFDPVDFVREAAKTCQKGGLFLLTANTISGFEYQILGRNSPRLVPPDRLNLLSTEAIYNLLGSHGFKILDLSTPGKLDVELVADAFWQNPQIEMPEFLRYMFKYRDRDTLESFQDFLQLSKLSSYLRVVAIKR